VEAWLEAVNAGGKMDKKTFWIVVGIAIAVLVIFAVWQTAKISTIASSAGSVVGSVSQATSSAASSGSGMVGGC